MGHIVPEMTMSSLLGIRVLCKAGCIVVFDNKTHQVNWLDELILTGYKDLKSNLWTLPISQEELWTTSASSLVDPRMHKILFSHHGKPNNAPACAAKFKNSCQHMPCTEVTVCPIWYSHNLAPVKIMPYCPPWPALISQHSHITTQPKLMPRNSSNEVFTTPHLIAHQSNQCELPQKVLHISPPRPLWNTYPQTQQHWKVVLSRDLNKRYS